MLGVRAVMGKAKPPPSPQSPYSHDPSLPPANPTSLSFSTEGINSRTTDPISSTFVLKENAPLQLHVEKGKNHPKIPNH
ncbi:hypothetical protein LOK49_LG02G03657 [Camellia lanceoleosa]|uniref:Uncharacterized protein n=1 Tax=Camellia lanceoleosa TaxID=1840588 RepID=A0ACC0IMH0_9ERIC|nr:hypothetical protein LOK49_LG02G03657 [Camellia lanceoleosa]